MADPITCKNTPTALPCIETEPEETLSTPTTIGPPPDPATARRLEQAKAEARMQQLADGGMSTRAGASAPGKLPVATTMQPRSELRKEYEAMKAARGNEKPIEFDPYGQAIASAGISSAGSAILTSLAAVAEHAVGESVVHAAFGAVEHQIDELGKENAERERDHAPRPSSPGLRKAPAATAAPLLHTPSMYSARIPG